MPVRWTDDALNHRRKFRQIYSVAEDRTQRWRSWFVFVFTFLFSEFVKFFTERPSARLQLSLGRRLVFFGLPRSDDYRRRWRLTSKSNKRRRDCRLISPSTSKRGLRLWSSPRAPLETHFLSPSRDGFACKTTLYIHTVYAYVVCVAHWTVRVTFSLFF